VSLKFLLFNSSTNTILFFIYKKECRANEEWIPCGNCTTLMCQLSCGSCKCRNGYIVHKNHCIRDCRSRACDEENEEYLKCSNCENCCFNNPRTTCDNTSCYEGCFCKHSYVRNPLEGTCVPYEKCPGKIIKFITTIFNLTLLL
jgi:hypothetical protein